MICDACNRNCACPRHLHTGEGKVMVALTAVELEYLLGRETGANVYGLMTRLEMALELLRGWHD